jgi:L-ascorbate metabolism protein UlaG (beta-lactamase superfamily)
MDLPTLRRLRAARSFVPLGNTALLARHGLPGATDLDWWQSTRLNDDVRITLVPAQHFSARALSDRDATLWGGFVVSGPSGHVYFAGDTGWGGHFAEIARRFGPMRAALLPIGAYLPRWFMKFAHISPAEAVDAHLTLGAQLSIGMHFGTFRLSDEAERQPVVDLEEALAERGRPSVLVAKHGQGIEVP